MKLLILDTRNNRHYAGDTRADLVGSMCSTGFLSLTPGLKTNTAGIYPSTTHTVVATVKGFSAPITLNFSDEYTAEELAKEINKGVIEQLRQNYGFEVFKNISEA